MKKILVVGVGLIGQEYVKILEDLECNVVVVGRSKENVKKFNQKTGIIAHAGGVQNFFKNNLDRFDGAIAAVGVESLNSVTKELLNNNLKNILVEKPGGNSINEISEIENLATSKKSNVFLAYNRRFYSSVEKAIQIIIQDGGVSSFNFEFTEWGHEIKNLSHSPQVKKNWFMGNSSHVVDMAFYLGGLPKKISSYAKDELDWHKPTNFSGAGITDNGALFSYQANWDAPGRWSVDIITKKHRLIFRPLEKLQIQKKGSVSIDYDLEIDYSLDEKYKPGFYKQTKSFIENNIENFCTISNQKSNYKKFYSKILNP